MEPLTVLAWGAVGTGITGISILGDYSGATSVAARCMSHQCARVFFNALKAAVLMAVSSLFLTLLMLAYLTLVDEPPPTHSQRVEAATYGCALAITLVLMDLVLNAVHWGLLVPSVLEALFESPEARRALSKERREAQALYDAAVGGALDDAPVAWLSLTAVHLTVVLVPTVVRPITGTRAPDAGGNAQLNTALLPLLVLAASFVVVMVLYGAFVRALRTLNEDRAGTRLAAWLCGELGPRALPAVFGASVARSFALVNAVITGILVLTTFDTRDAAAISNWNLLFLGLPVSAAACVPASLCVLRVCNGPVGGAPPSPMAYGKSTRHLDRIPEGFELANDLN